MHDLKIGEVSLFIFYRITFSSLYPLNGFRFIFLLRDSENDLRSLMTREYLSQPWRHLA